MKDSKLIQDLQYVYFGCTKDTGHFDEHYDSENGTKQNAKTNIIEDDLWNNSLGLFASVIGCEKSDVQPSKWKESISSRARFFNTPVLKEFPWKSFSGFIHFRNKYDLIRKIDNCFIDLFLLFSTDPYGISANAELSNDPEVLNELFKLKDKLQEVLSQMAKVVLNDISVEVKISDPVWEDDCIPVYGGDGYWIKGIII